MVHHRVTFLFFEEIPMQNMRTTRFEAITWWPIEISVKFQKRLIANQGSPIRWSRDQWSWTVTWPAFWKLGQGSARECGISRSPIEISEKFQKRLIANQGSPIGWSRDQWSRVVTWPAFWKLGQGAAQECGVSWSPMEISEKIQKRLIANQGSPIRWSRDQWSWMVTWPAFWKLGQGSARECGISGRDIEISEKFQKRLIANQGSADRMVTWPMISRGHVTCFLETRSRCSTRMWHISVADRDIWKIPKATNSKSGVADRMVTWPMISRGHVTRFLETRSRCSTRMWCISVADGDIGKNPKATNSKSGVADQMVTWPMILDGHVTCFLETRSRCSTRMWHISVADRDIGKIPKATNSKSGVADRMVTWPMISRGHVTRFL